jgi:RimJ/RimL family protein N-acetyltransferase
MPPPSSPGTHRQLSGSPHWQPTLTGDRVNLRPIAPEDLDPLHAAASDPLIWAQHSVRDRHERAVFERYFAGAIACGGGLVAADRVSGRIIGASRYYGWDPDERSVIIGYTFLERIGATLHARQEIDVDGTPSTRLVYSMRPGDFRG